MSKTNSDAAYAKGYADERDGKSFESPNDMADHFLARQGAEHRSMIDADRAARAGRDQARKDKDR